MIKNRLNIALVLLVTASLACNFMTGMGKKQPTPETGVGKPLVTPAAAGSEATQLPTLGVSTAEAPAGSQPNAGNKQYKTEFPLPADISNFVDMGSGSINFQAKMSLKDAIAFYRDNFANAGYKERQVNTSITDTTFSLVFDGHASGKAIVVQGVELGGTVNINIRFEDI